MLQLSLGLPAAPLPPDSRRYVTVTCWDEKGNAWCHRVSDPEETIRIVQEIPGAKAKVRR